MPPLILTIKQTRRNRMEQTVPISRHLSYLHGCPAQIVGVGSRSGTVTAANVGEVFPFARCAGVEIGEEAVGVDFGGGVPGGMVVV